MSRTLAICVATYRRPLMLRRLLHALAACEAPAGYRVQLRIVDNDPESRASLTSSASDLGAMDFVYLREPQRGIAAARNAALAVGPADLVVFVDDDEVPPRDWLLRLVVALDQSEADAVVGPVRGRCPANTPEWIVRGGYFDKPTAPAGTAMHWRGGRTSNTAVRGEWFYQRGLRFNAAFGLSGAEDTEMFLQMARLGARFAGAPDAWVCEDVEPDRARFGWLWRRHVRGGRNYRRLCNLADRSPPEALLCTARLLRGCSWTLAGLPWLMLGRPEHSIRGVLQFALAIGGLEAWLTPARAAAQCAYPERSAETAQCASHS